MDTVGIRELKSGLSRYLKRVRAGGRVTVTERGRAIATISPVDLSGDLKCAHALVGGGRAQWAGGKPRGVSHDARPASSARRSVSAAVLEDRQ